MIIVIVCQRIPNQRPTVGNTCMKTYPVLLTSQYFLDSALLVLDVDSTMTNKPVTKRKDSKKFLFLLLENNTRLLTCLIMAPKIPPKLVIVVLIS